MDTLSDLLAKILSPLLKPVSQWLLSPKRSHPTWHFETACVAFVLLVVALFTTPSVVSLWIAPVPFLIVWLSAVAVLGSFLHAKVGYRMAEALAEQATPPAACQEWSGTYWVAKELLWLVVFVLSGAYPAIAGAVIFILYPAWRKIHVSERRKLRG